MVPGCQYIDLGLGNGYTLDRDFSSSSVLNANTPAKNGRLNYNKGSSWCAATNDSQPYLQVDFEKLYIICSVSTQGNSQGDEWVRKYTLQSSRDEATWTDYQEAGNVINNKRVQFLVKKFTVIITTERLFKLFKRTI